LKKDRRWWLKTGDGEEGLGMEENDRRGRGRSVESEETPAMVEKGQ
jgi:hypothetical protein